MKINTEKKITVADAERDFLRVVQMAETDGSVVIFQDDKPRYMLTDLQNGAALELTDDEKIEIVAKRMLKKYRKAFEELAK